MRLLEAALRLDTQVARTKVGEREIDAGQAVLGECDLFER